jgi:hypothetical protein
LFMIFRPKKKRDRFNHWQRTRHGFSGSDTFSNEDYLDSTSVFGGIKKTIISKDFKGGEVTCVFGGAEINLMQADINGKVTLEATQVFGGTKLIVPSHWQVQPEMTAVLGGIEDRRPVIKETDPNKVLIIKGTSIFGGMEIISY